MQKFGYKSTMQIPRLEKIVVNVGCSEARENAKVLDAVVSDLTTITGQKAVITKAKKSVANFKLREGMPIGAKVTLRGNKMWEFLDRLFNVAQMCIRDSRYTKRGGKVWIKIFPDKPVTEKPAETRMGSGKGSPEYWVAVVKPGRVMFEIAGVPEEIAREALRLASHKLPIKSKIMKREDLEVQEVGE